MATIDLSDIATMDLLLMRKHLRGTRLAEDQEALGSVDEEIKTRSKTLNKK